MIRLDDDERDRFVRKDSDLQAAGYGEGAGSDNRLFQFGEALGDGRRREALTLKQVVDFRNRLALDQNLRRGSQRSQPSREVWLRLVIPGASRSFGASTTSTDPELTSRKNTRIVNTSIKDVRFILVIFTRLRAMRLMRREFLMALLQSKRRGTERTTGTRFRPRPGSQPSVRYPLPGSGSHKGYAVPSGLRRPRGPDCLF